MRVHFCTPRHPCEWDREMDAVPRAGEYICRYAPEYGEGPKYFKVTEVVYCFDHRPYSSPVEAPHAYVILRDTDSPLGVAKRRGATAWDHVLGRRKRA